MANNPMGLDLSDGSLDVCNLKFNGVSLGKTLDEVTIDYTEDIKDIFFAQDGTQPADKVVTGQAYIVKAKLAQTTWARLKELMRGVTVVGHSALLAADLYRSGKDNFAKELVLSLADSDGVSSAVPEYILTFYKAYPRLTGPMATFGPDTQRAVDVEFYCFRDATRHNAFGVSGHASSLGTGY
jgi:hypothetical protein